MDAYRTRSENSRFPWKTPALAFEYTELMPTPNTESHKYVVLVKYLLLNRFSLFQILHYAKTEISISHMVLFNLGAVHNRQC